MVTWVLFASVTLPNTSVATLSVPALNCNVGGHLDQGCCTPTHCFEQQLDPKALGRLMPLWDIRMWFSCIDAFNHNDKDETRCKEEGSNQHSQVIWEQQPEEVVCDCKPEPSKDLTLVQQSFVVRVTVHGVECSDVGIG